MRVKAVHESDTEGGSETAAPGMVPKLNQSRLLKVQNECFKNKRKSRRRVEELCNRDGAWTVAWTGQDLKDVETHFRSYKEIRQQTLSSGAASLTGQRLG